MRYIEKGDEPASLTEYKKEANAYFDGYTKKDDVRESLIVEQGYLCGYCMRRIKKISDVKIEHIIPQSALKENERKALDYKIMLGVCYGNEKKGRRKNCLTCDAHRGAIDIHVTPFDENIIKQIKYGSDGCITSDNKKLRDTLINVLNLNYNGPDAYLVQNRKAVLEECKRKLMRMQKEGLWDKKRLEKMLKFYQEPNSKGEYVPFSGIAIWYLNKRLNG